MVFSVKFDRMLIFQWFDGIFGWIVVIFDGVKSGEMLDFSGFYRSGYRTQKWGSRCGNIRYAVPGFRLPTLKCKPRPHHGIKSHYNSTVLWYIFIVSSKNALHLQ